MTILITGDTHGDIDIRKLASKKIEAIESNFTKDDYLIICGDFGLVWDYKRTKREQWWFNWLDEKPWTTLFVDGNHEGFDALYSYPVEMWNGGKVHKVSESVYHLVRGQVFDLQGKKFFTMGGARSHDIEYRIPGVSWWEQEIPSDEEREEALINLEKHNWKVDYVITHDCPTSIANKLIDTPDRKVDEYTDWLEKIANNLEFNQWFFGHYHKDEEFMDGMFNAMYNDIGVLK